MPAEDEIESLRAERDEWRRRAELAEAVAAERLARAETAERALRTAEAALSTPGGPSRVSQSTAAAAPGVGASAGQPVDGEPKRPASLLERWRRYTETIE